LTRNVVHDVILKWLSVSAGVHRGMSFQRSRHRLLWFARRNSKSTPIEEADTRLFNHTLNPPAAIVLLINSTNTAVALTLTLNSIRWLPKRSSIVTEEPPTGSTIVSETDNDTITYRWSPTSRHPIQWIPVLFGGFMIFAAIFMPITMLSEPDEFAPPLEVAITFSAILLCLGSMLLYAGLKRRGKETLKLSHDAIEYDTGPSILLWPLMLWFGPMFLYGPQMFGGTPPALFIRKRHNFPADSIGAFTLERVGERQRLRVDHGADRVEIGALLREPEREWLAAQLVKWQSSIEKGS
jgi:hypothetical protein